MSRITGNDARGLVEAYQAVYAPQELTEEQVWEEVENWVNSLLEEGYDLSDYTWEEMYEAYLEEASDLDMGLGKNVLRDRADREKTASRSPSPATPQPQLKGLSIGKGGFNINNKPVNTGISPIFQRPGTKPAPTTNIRTPSRLTPGVTTVPIRPRTPAAAPATARPAAATPAAKPAAATPAAKPAMGPTGKPLVGGIERRTPTRAEMDAAKAYRTPAATTGTLGAATAAATATPTAFGSSTPAAAPASKPAAAPTPTPAAAPAPKPAATSALGSKKPGSMVSHFDPFDVVKGHLLDEGYADTEESALAIMTNMSEEWRRSILDNENLQEKLKKGTKGRIDFTTGKQNFDQKMTEKNPQTGRQRATSPMHKAMGAHSGARAAQHDAEQSGDREGAQRHAQRRGRLATAVYNRTNRIIDRADND